MQTQAKLMQLVRALSLLTELLFAAGARRVLLPFDGMPELLGPDRSRAVLDEPPPKATMEVVTVHMMGTAAIVYALTGNASRAAAILIFDLASGIRVAAPTTMFRSQGLLRLARLPWPAKRRQS